MPQSQVLLGLYAPGFTAGATYESTDLQFAAVPIPAGLPLLAAGIGALGLVGWRKHRRTPPNLVAAA